MYTPSYTDLASHLSMVTCAHILLIQHAQCNTHGAPLHVVTPMNLTSAASNVEFIFYIYINMWFALHWLENYSLHYSTSSCRHD